jgi:hypothetical protein
MKSIIDQLEAKQREWEKERYNLIQSSESAVMSLYKLRTFVDDQIRKKVPFDNIMVEVIKKLKEVTPHGPESQCDK